MLTKYEKKIVKKALKEDIESGDITTALTVPPDSRCAATLVAKEAGVLSGIEVFRHVFGRLEAKIDGWETPSDGTLFEAGDLIAQFEGETAAILTGERTAMNFLQHLSGVATLTKAFVDAVDGLDVKICDTRKTMPLLRAFEKAAVLHGGGTNHRFNLSDGILIKDNHVAAAGGVAVAVRKARQNAHHLMKVEVEVASLEDLQEAIDGGADVILLDNMRLDQLRAAVEDTRGRNVVLEASGNITLDNVREVAETGVDIISVGALTHSAPAVDLSLRTTNV